MESRILLLGLCPRTYSCLPLAPDTRYCTREFATEERRCNNYKAWYNARVNVVLPIVTEIFGEELLHHRLGELTRGDGPPHPSPRDCRDALARRWSQPALRRCVTHDSAHSGLYYPVCDATRYDCLTIDCERVFLSSAFAVINCSRPQTGFHLHCYPRLCDIECCPAMQPRNARSRGVLARRR